MNDYTVNLITDATAEPITLADAKKHCNVLAAMTDDDTLIGGLITAARNAVEKEIQRPIGSHTYQLLLRYWPMKIEFPFPPLIDVTKITYRLYGGTVNTLLDKGATPPIASTVFTVDPLGDPGEMWVRPTELWPADILDQGFPIVITYTAGITVLPSGLLLAIKQLLATWYENREAVLLGRVNQGYEMPMSVQWLCDKFAFKEFG